MLSNKLISQIEQELYKDMAEKSKMFKLLGLKSLRKIKTD